MADRTTNAKPVPAGGEGRERPVDRVDAEIRAIVYEAHRARVPVEVWSRRGGTTTGPVVSITDSYIEQKTALGVRSSTPWSFIAKACLATPPSSTDGDGLREWWIHQRHSSAGDGGRRRHWIEVEGPLLKETDAYESVPPVRVRERPAGETGAAVTLDCRSEIGITVGLVDALIAILRVIVSRDLTAPAVIEALRDLAQDPGISVDQLSTLEEGGEGVGLSATERTAKALGTDLVPLFDEAGYEDA